MTALNERAPSAAPKGSRFTRASILPFTIDLVCIVAFVAIGKENHGVDRGVGWFVNVWWPLAVGLIVGALVTRLYTATDRWPLRLIATVAIMVVVGGPLRALTGRTMFTVFTVVAFGMLTLMMFAWRLLRVAYHQTRGPAASG